MPERNRHERALTVGLAALVVTVGVVSFDRARRGEYDFDHFYRDARYVWEHRALNPSIDDPDPEQRRRLPFYLPVVPLMLAPLTALGHEPAALLWAAAQVAALGYSLRVLRRWSGTGASPAALAVAGLLAVPACIEAARFNQLSFLVLVLVLGATSALERDRPRTAGALLGAVAVLKLLPVIFLPWLLLKRRWSAAAALVVTGVLAALLPCLVVFGPQRTLAYHREWWAYNVAGDAARGLMNPALREHFVDHRNQSIPQVLARLAWPQHPAYQKMPWHPVQLSESACRRTAYGVAAALLAALVWLTRRPWPSLSTDQRRAEVALYAVAMLVISPLLRSYYLIWALPALVLAAREAADAHPGRARRIGGATLIVWTAGMLAWPWELPRLLGVHLVMLIVIGVLMMMLMARTGRSRQPVNCRSVDPITTEGPR